MGNGWHVSLDNHKLFPNLYNTGARAYQNSLFNKSTGGIFLDDVGCEGSESALINCTHQGIGIHDCNHYHEAGVSCLGNYLHINLKVSAL